MIANSLLTRWSQVEARPKNACSVVEMHMLSEGHMLGSCGKNPKCLNSAQKNSFSGTSLLSGSETQ